MTQPVPPTNSRSYNWQLTAERHRSSGCGKSLKSGYKFLHSTAGPRSVDITVGTLQVKHYLHKTKTDVYQISWPLKVEPIGCSETPRNIPEERRSHQHRDGSLKSRRLLLYSCSWFKDVCVCVCGVQCDVNFYHCVGMTMCVCAPDYFRQQRRFQNRAIRAFSFTTKHYTEEQRHSSSRA